MKGKETGILKLLMESRGKELSISQIAKNMNKDYKNTHNIVGRLAKMKIVEIQPFGKSHRIVLNNEANPLIFKAEYERRAELLKNKDMAVMLDSFKALRSKFYILLVFGSHAKKTSTKHSDIDLMFIVPDEGEGKMEKEIQGIADTIPLKLHVNVFRESDFMAMRDSRQATVGLEAINSNIILHGIEAYYEMIQ